MRISKTGSQWVRLFGFLIFGWGILSTIADFASRMLYSFPLEMGIVLGNGAILLVGLVAITAAKALKNLEERLDRIEDNRSASAKAGGGDGRKV
jgi:TRAP-type C4-dicarboxylate transport system permease small subunit